MQWYEILSLFGFPTLAALIIGDIYSRAKLNGKKYKEHKKAEEDVRLKKIVTEVMQKENQDIKKDIEETKQIICDIKSDDIDILKKANRDSLRNQLYDMYDRCIEYKTNSDIENEAEMFDSYKRLKGNHGCDDRHELFKKLPTEDQYFYNQRHPEKKKDEEE